MTSSGYRPFHSRPAALRRATRGKSARCRPALPSHNYAESCGALPRMTSVGNQRGGTQQRRPGLVDGLIDALMTPAQLVIDLPDAKPGVTQIRDLDPLVLLQEPAADLAHGQPVRPGVCGGATWGAGNRPV
jgi:hypothetical protein